ncbi:MAG TPA: M12 family metallo-peptidase [Opitutaceae bacterium]|nr:M12 family metallo-peptidase [Opitutaceae bacterium]
MRRICLLLTIAGVVVVFLCRHALQTRSGKPDEGGSIHRAVARTVVALASTKTPAVPAGGLLAFAAPASAAALDVALPAPTRVIHYVRVDRRLIESKASPFWTRAGRLELPRPDGGTYTVVIDDSVMLGPDRFTSTGHIEGEQPSRVVLAYNRGYLSGSVETAGYEYALRPATDTLSQYYQVDPAMVGNCGGAIHPPIDAATVAAVAAHKQRQAELASSAAPAGAPATAAAVSPSGVVVDVMMLYTQAVKPTMTGDARVAALQSEFDAAIAKVNAELSASQVSARVRLVKIAQTQYNADGPVTNAVANFQSDALTALYTTSDGNMDEIHALRDQAGADVVVLALNRSDTASIGLSFVLDTPALVEASAASYNPLYAFSVVQYSTIAGTDVVPHELGHVFGCAHARGDPGATGTKDGAYTYSYGYRFYGADGRQYHDIMAYSPGTPLSYYSNPDLTVPAPVNAPIGIAPGQPGEADCALTIDQDAFEVASYRLQTQAAPAGTLVNVSTRAYVGTGNQVLIGGFIIDGAQSKRVLIRAAGPALAGYGVTDALSAPVLDVYSGANVIAHNAGWSSQTGADTVAAVSNQVGAFAFAAGSGDDAVLTTLAPGAYTAIVQGASGSSGSGLVEVYDVDRTGNKIINLSTRGYSDIGKPMIGGFVVNGEAGTTKRVLIRVRGPTLNRDFGITEAMDDPMLELHDAAGDLLIKNDDWSSGDTAGVINPTNDFSPAVKTYSEQEISATGLAPANRREPCVLVDLAPGAYSAVVLPFQDLTATPPEPAAPGVGIVEVYEIAQ